MPFRIVIVLTLVVLSGCARDAGLPVSNAPERDAESTAIRSAMKKVETFFTPMGKPGRSDWLYTHKEAGETFEQYLAAAPTGPNEGRQRIYVLPLGNFSVRQLDVIETTGGFLRIFYGLPLTVLPAKGLDRTLRSRDNRVRSGSKARQVRTGYILNEILKPALPNDAAALIAFTSDDLFIDSSTNFVFGEASMSDRIGVWSLFRLGQNANQDLFLRRTIKIASHELGHIFSMHHCTKFECLMSGTNYLGETDRRPLDACPECSAKIWWLTRADPEARYRRLADFCKANGLAAESAEFTRKAAAVGAR